MAFDNNKTDHEARTIHCANLVPEKISEEVLYELFLQVNRNKY